MMVSTRGKYALRVMIDLAEHGSGSYVAMKEVAERQEISLKYLEKILPPLVSGGLIEGVSGKGGGYRLTKDPSEYRVGEILKLTEGDLSPTACSGDGNETCDRAGECRIKPVFDGLGEVITGYLDRFTLADLASGGDGAVPAPSAGGVRTGENCCGKRAEKQ